MTDGERKAILRAFGEALAERRRALGITQADLAERLGHATHENISRYERGEREPRLSTLVTLAEQLGMTAGDLVGAAGARRTNPAASPAGCASVAMALVAKLEEGNGPLARVAVDVLRVIADSADHVSVP